jgi:hypothetical protein
MSRLPLNIDGLPECLYAGEVGKYKRCAKCKFRIECKQIAKGNNVSDKKLLAEGVTVQSQEAKVALVQEADGGSLIDGLLEIGCEDCGGGNYIVLTTERWAIDGCDIDKFAGLLKHLLAKSEMLMKGGESDGRSIRNVLADNRGTVKRTGEEA